MTGRPGAAPVAVIAGAATILLLAATALDVSALLRRSTPVLHIVSYYLLPLAWGTLLALLLFRPVLAAPRRSALADGAVVLLLALAWWLRGHPEVMPDPPLVAVQIASALSLAGRWYRRRRRGRRQA